MRIRENAERQVGLGLQQDDLVGDQERFVVAGVRKAHLPGIQVQTAHEEGREHIAVIAPAEFFIQDPEDVRRVVFLLGNHPEQGTDHRHQHRRRDALATDVSDTEKGLSVPDKIIENVAAHFPR